MLAPGHATYEGKYASVKDAINVPKGIQKAAAPDHRRRQRPRRDLPAGRPFRRRAEFGLHRDREGGRADPDRPSALRGDRPRSGHAPSVAVLRRRDAKTPGQQRVDFIGRCVALGWIDWLPSRRASPPLARRRPATPRIAGPPAWHWQTSLR